MKFNLSAVAIVAAATFASIGAQAADGTITFNGTVTDTTCSINGAAAGAGDKTITLPSVSKASLAAAGQTAGTSSPADIKFALTGCTGSATKVVARFENGPTVDQASGRLVNTAGAGAATNVQIELLNKDQQPINVTTNSNNAVAANGATIASGAANLVYYGRYYATGAATAGSVSSTVQYTMQYQ
ncbi:fimbrial protein [Variovorax dokdonensis]|uniref:Fimbrial protein n=1 Tax=Variovorax dokdonensis TaxID=344883 RepID=A0ABT7N8N4_9BURK|nr:fimbrial protein [Variovorax dokdonensis]MDM0044283.1 fimbrial protein [Variovorax dokdonensis]